jgi:hypothetical protein
MKIGSDVVELCTDRRTDRAILVGTPQGYEHAQTGQQISLSIMFNTSYDDRSSANYQNDVGISITCCSESR